MAQDIIGILKNRFKAEEGVVHPDVILVGHSMGGALAVHTALTGEVPNLIGVCVIDVVEGNNFLA